LYCKYLCKFQYQSRGLCAILNLYQCLQYNEWERSMKPIRILPVLLSFLLLGGCTFPSGDELLAAPRPSTNYQTLQTELDQRLASGVSYTAPTEGENRSSIQ